ncbi:tyrosine-type recombinase/integrase [Frankia sp. Cas3]|uniref:tyrosine-type recombinase/integrase n=1 Tax=Frankia sp. Cas3 TaxID=3073926 RepID=UPI002AD26971|nr:tyrosine-type recombinase/integrase [Frankia sp. Cas3]
MGGAQPPESSLENRETASPGRPGRRAVAVPEPYATVLAAYTAALARAPVSDQTRRTYASKVRQYLAWLADSDLDGDPLADRAARDWAVRDYRSHLQNVLKREPRTVNNALAAVDDFYTRHGLGPAAAARASLPKTAPRALSHRAAVRFLREIERWPSPRDAALALVPFYAGARIAETVGLDVDDVALSSRKGSLRIHGKGDQIRRVPIHPPLRKALSGWLEERPDWPGADDNPALFLNQQGGRLSTTSAHTIITTLAEAAGLDEKTTAHVLRHTFATSLVRGGTDLVTVAELLGHSRLETVRIYTQPTEDDKIRALDHLILDE